MATQISGQPDQGETAQGAKPPTTGTPSPVPPYDYSYPGQSPGPGPYYQYPQQPGGYYYQGQPPRYTVLSPNRRRSHPVALTLAFFFGGVIFLTILAGVFFSLFALNILDWPGNGPLITDNRTVALGNATQANVEINKGVGNLTVSSGASDLLNGTYYYNNSQWKPEVNYNVNGTTGTLTVRQPNGSFFGSSRYNWDLQFKNGIPLDFRFDLGVGNSTLNLSGLTLSGLSVQAGVGNIDINLAGITTTNMIGNINGGVGNLTIRIPRDIGVQIVVNHGLGQVNVNGLKANGNTYTNDAFGTAANSIRLYVSGGVGQITINQ